MGLAVTRKLLAAVTILIFFLSAKGSAEEVPNKIKEKIGQKLSYFQHAVRSKPDTDETWKELKPNIIALLDRAHDSLAAGRVYAALDDLARAWVPFVSAGYADANPSVQKEGMPAFDAEWRRMAGEMDREEANYRAGTWENIPAAVRAIAESHQGQMRPLYQASHAYAAVTEPKYAIYNLGEAKASGEIALFCQSLRLESLQKPLAVRSSIPEIERLQEKVRAAYQPPRSIDHHSEFIRLSSVLKLAQELDAAELYYGAFYEYLDALRLYSALDSAAAAPPTGAAVRAKIAPERKRLSGASTDSSIGELFLEQAESRLSGAGAKRREERSKAQIILNDVIPAYFSVLEKAIVPATTTSRQLRVTLVRWPYT